MSVCLYKIFLPVQWRIHWKSCLGQIHFMIETFYKKGTRCTCWFWKEIRYKSLSTSLTLSSLVSYLNVTLEKNSSYGLIFPKSVFSLTLCQKFIATKTLALKFSFTCICAFFSAIRSKIHVYCILSTSMWKHVFPKSREFKISTFRIYFRIILSFSSKWIDSLTLKMPIGRPIYKIWSIYAFTLQILFFKWLFG